MPDDRRFVNVSIYLSQDEHRAFVEAAEREKRSKASLARVAISEWLEQHANVRLPTVTRRKGRAHYDGT
jgi:hypothetical protein